MDKRDWLISVLRDLEAYAETNELQWLSHEISQTKLTAIAEISGAVEERPIASSRVQTRSN